MIQLSERLYHLLPGIYQSYDALQGESLRALLALLERELQIVETDLDRLYEAWFIETCEDWVVPYIGELLDAQTLYSRSLRQGQERRAFIANTISYRRQKGTTTVLEQLAIDISGWYGRAVESVNLLGHSSELSIAAEPVSNTVDLRRIQQLEQLSSPFEQGAFTTEIRNGRYSLGTIGLFLWRLQSYPLTRVSARAIELSSNRYTFNPLGYDTPLFNQPQTKSIATEPTIALHVPDRLNRAALFNEIQQRRTGKNIDDGYFGISPVFQIFLDGQTEALQPEQILITDLSAWKAPNWTSDDSRIGYEVAVDPELGRFIVLNRPRPKRVEVSYSYGFSADTGGGSYNRPRVETNTKPIVWQVKDSLQNTIAQWHQTIEAWQACRDYTYIPLAKLQVPSLPRLALEPARRFFTPGIVTGLEVLATPGAGAIIVNRGSAIDTQGRLIQLEQPFTILLDQYKDQTVFIVAVHSNSGSRIEVISAAIADRHSPQIYLRLALVSVNGNGQMISHSTAQRLVFQPGIISGLKVELNQDSDGLLIQPGLAVNGAGQLIDVQVQDAIAFTPERDRTMLLVLSRCLELGKQRGQQWKLDWIQKSEEHNYPSDRFIRLVQLPDSPKQSIASTDNDLRPNFKSGIVWGLSVIAYPGQNRAIVTPGVAIGIQGETISVPTNQRIPLRGYPSSTVTIYLIYQSSEWSIMVAGTSPGKTAIALARITLDSQGRVYDLPDVSLRSRFDPGILQGLEVNTRTKTATPQVSIGAGTAIDAQGRSLTIPSQESFDLRNYRGQTVVLFLAYEARSGWRFGAVAEETEIGRIEIQDSASYNIQNLEIQVPSEKRLEIIAANGFRSHLQGNLKVRGFGEFALEGLLIEGNITILPGSLKHFELTHCTLVPNLGRLTVQSAPKPVIAPEFSEWSMIAFVMYYVYLIWELIAINLNSQKTSSQILAQLIQLGIQRVQYLAMDFWRSCRSLRSSDILATYTVETEDNEQLEIVLDHSICGAIQIDAAIAQLSIVDSIIEHKIEALSSPVLCKNTTVLGSTIVLSLEAINTLFTEHVTVWRQQVGSLRFCYVPDESRTPRRYRCQPDQVLESLDRLPSRITALTSNDDTLFAGTANGKIWRSTNAGESWQEVNKGLLNLPIQTIVIDAQRVYVGTTEGYIFSTSDNGENWKPLIQLRSEVVTRNVSVNTPTINQIIAKDGQFFAATLGGRVFRSWDWTASQIGLEQAIWTINTIVVHPRTGWIFAGTAGSGIYYSQDNTQSWQKPLSINLTNQTITALAIDSKGKIFAGTTGVFTKDSGIFYSTNNGESWVFVQLPVNQRNISAIAVHPNGSIFAGTTSGGLICSQDEGQTWITTSLPHQNITALTINQQGQIFVGTAGGMIWRSQNNGENWTPSQTGFNNAEAKQLLINQLQPSFTSRQYGNPGYAQLSLTCANEICVGAEDSAEIGCFNSLKQPQRKANLQTSLTEYLRFGLEVNPFYMT
ncbi:glycosyl hydrolase, BNR repeat-containing protein [Leptolyngbya sp. NIES-3755]|nr:glycosyl hydrolase, BNR repeat-containing protein [Leptolyngbya sp. NIES-3755]